MSCMNVMCITTILILDLADSQVSTSFLFFRVFLLFLSFSLFSFDVCRSVLCAACVSTACTQRNTAACTAILLP